MSQRDRTISPARYGVLLASTPTRRPAFLTSSAIIILLMNHRSFVLRLRGQGGGAGLEVVVVLDMVGLMHACPMAAYWAGSTCRGQTDMYTLVLTAAVLLVVYAVQLPPKLRRLSSPTCCAAAVRPARPGTECCRPSRTTSSTTTHGRPCWTTSAGSQVRTSIKPDETASFGG
ncbi:hypothetical protein C2845_PM10G03300 [Panicum miliaceum]|uniref:Uncharacterized protein n=1 Tax=Panicum miliaceum TaxID=4540 RepID=A0A3L6PCI6_PANMI|nr:hypothetical protein C2845_PM10G03300 [Panicum miliaceum]